MKVAIIGCGWLGERLAKFLSAQGFYTITTTTLAEKLPRLQKISSEVHLLRFGLTANLSFLNAVDAVIFSMPAARNDWHQGFQQLKADFPKSIFFSSTGIYPQQSGIYTEEYKDNLRNDLVLSEQTVLQKYPKTNILRLGGLMGDERNLGNFFRNSTPQDPGKAANHIHYEDIIQAVVKILYAEVHAEIFNLVAPVHPTLAEILSLDQGSAKESPRIVSGEKFIQNFNYTFIHSNPQYFSK